VKNHDEDKDWPLRTLRYLFVVLFLVKDIRPDLELDPIDPDPRVCCTMYKAVMKILCVQGPARTVELLRSSITNTHAKRHWARSRSLSHESHELP
jgi:hypothetical protein